MHFIGWFDHDADHERSVLGALAAANGQDARDELGLGAIRDSFADSFFPGLSSVQTRLRYFLFAQWGCEQAACSSDEADIMARLHDGEVRLIAALTPLGAGQGVIGIQSQEALERMPSDVYWTGLRTLGMLRARGGRRHWARLVARNRDAERRSPPPESRERPSVDIGFDMSRPPRPADFPALAVPSFTLEPDERLFLRERLADACVNPSRLGHQFNLFGTFSGHRRRTAVGKPWDHPRAGSLSGEAHACLRLAAAFSRVMRGATILYNLLVAQRLAEDDKGADHREKYRREFRTWQAALDPDDVAMVRDHRSEVRRLADYTRHRLRPDATLFVENWARFCAAPERLLRDGRPAALIIQREISLKAARGSSRFQNEEARRRWGGESGGELDYRWPVARQFLNDLAG